MNVILRELKRLKETGKISTSIGAKNACKVLDLHNQGIDDANEKSFDNQIHDRNKYFRKLALWSMLNPGEKYKSEIIVTSSMKNKAKKTLDK